MKYVIRCGVGQFWSEDGAWWRNNVADATKYGTMKEAKDVITSIGLGLEKATVEALPPAEA